MSQKDDKDRAALLYSYRVMCKTFRVPLRLRISAKDFACMTKNQVYQACRDLYNGALADKAMKLAIRLGKAEKRATLGLFGIIKQAFGYLRDDAKLEWARARARVWLFIHRHKKVVVRG